MGLKQGDLKMGIVFWFNFWWGYFFGLKRKCQGCGKSCQRMEFYKQPYPTEGFEYHFLRQAKSETYCHECLETFCIYCAKCGGSIGPGDPITIFLLPENQEILPHFVFFDSNRPIACTRFECARMKADDQVVFWLSPGKVSLFTPSTEGVNRKIITIVGRGLRISLIDDPREG